MTADWPTTRARIVDAFDGELPGAQLETALIDIYEDNPGAVINAIASIAESLQAGRINSGWAVLRKAAATKAVTNTNPTISREKLIRNAEQWLRNAGLMYDRWTEAHDELFGDRGRLRSIQTDQIISRYREAWESLQPDREQVEADELARAEQWKQFRAELATKPRVEPQDAHALITGGPSGNPA